MNHLAPSDLMHELKHLIHLSCELITTLGALILIFAGLMAALNLSLCCINLVVGTKLKMVDVIKDGSYFETGVACNSL